MSTLRVGIIGTGAIGVQHLLRIHNKLQGAEVVGVNDYSREAAEKAAALIDAKVYESPEALINSPEVDAIVVTSPGFAHAASVLEAIKVGKPVFTEKPLSTSAADSKSIVDAEIAGGKKLVQVGFMRRYDTGYIQLKNLIDSGKYGEPLLIKGAHRNPTVDTNYITAYAVHDTAIHEIDVLHWLVGANWVSAQVIIGKQTKYTHGALRDPQTMILIGDTGLVVTLEVNVNCQFGYDIQCEVVTESAALRLPNPSFPIVKSEETESVKILNDWADRFIDAYDVELQDWIDSTLKGEVNGPTAWDGYLANLTADALVAAQESGNVEAIAAGTTPAFYA
ncbi:MAG: Gfo/Idh/MocA family oxidoreductase [Clostridiales Family XIII bacterium]|jgi:myo-inositol 2-dehydrogenase/D-chiro-inositol 1-dehydrogenase|nr:Gfo/Idh/MocA family oxidoreductase [Clostridiales Family XIII bacterium]